MKKRFYIPILVLFLINFNPVFGGTDTVTLEEWTLVIGVVIAAIASAAGLIFSYKENRRAQNERQLNLVQGFSGQLTILKDKERSLKTKKDCVTYALNFVDLLDQIAYLQEEEKIPKQISKYFENEFSYGLTMIDWLRENDEIDPFEVNVSGGESIGFKSTKEWIEDPRGYTELDDKFPAKDLLQLCKTEQILPYSDDNLPDAMKHYDDLPEEEVERTLDLVRGYGEKLTDLTKQEKNLEDKLDCELYSVAYLDLMDAIAFLYRQYIIPEKIAEYFENNFCYALTLNSWLIQHKSAEKNSLPICLRVKKNGKKVEQYIEDMEIGEWLMLDDWLKQKIPQDEYDKLPIDVNERNLWKKNVFAKDWLNEKLTKEWIKKNIGIEELREDLPENIKNSQDSDRIAEAWLKIKSRDIAEKLVVGSQYTWTDLLMWAKQKNLTPFPKTELPPIMQLKNPSQKRRRR